MVELFLELGHLRERAFEPAVLEEHARVAGERLEEAEVFLGERAHVTDPVAHQQQPEHALLTVEGADDGIVEPARGEEPVERVRRPAPGKQSRAARRRCVPDRELVGRRHDLPLHQRFAGGPTDAAERGLARRRRQQQDLRVLGPQQTSRRDQ
jgi:hypothetical protein